MGIVQEDYTDLKRTACEELGPYHIKSSETFKALLSEIGFQQEYIDSVVARYEEITIEDTLKLLVRCKKLFESRPSVVEILRNINSLNPQVEAFRIMVAG